MKNKIVILVLARGQSKGVPRKNIKLLNGKPLMAYVIEEAKKLSYPIYVSTEDPEIKEVALGLGVNVIDRPEKLAKDDSRSIDAIRHAQRQLKADYIILLNACCPLTKAEDIKNCVDILTGEKCDSVVSLVEDFSSHPSKICNLIGNRVYPIQTGYTFQTAERQKLNKVFKRNTSIYGMSKNTIRKGLLFGKDTRGYVMSRENSWDINTLWDFEICEFLITK